MKKLVLTTDLIAGSTGFSFAQDLVAGATTFKKCAICHDIGETAKNKVGPELNGIDGRPSGSASGYNYSDVNKKSGITWNETTFLEYIKDPRAKIPGTKMIFPGIKDETEAKNLWGLSETVWLRRQKEMIVKMQGQAIAAWVTQSA